MITEDKSNVKSMSSNEFSNEDQKNQESAQKKDSSEEIGNPVNNGGVSASKNDLHLEKQWLAIRDEYLSNFPETKDIDIVYEQNDIKSLITDIAVRRQKTDQEIKDEIINWTPKK
ncbi:MULTISPECIES: hypothetical protein [Maribacter]|uniref:hypothetical protein n=1 Tax=Maribacter TaxID=252356 RepID=UPI00047D3919|nr:MULTISPECIES: hypothetical protein [Maribacter]|tara:strand:+ start:1248 stop:1592 length:345 start_codon:yes stop_codon:yes gene_type:complete